MILFETINILTIDYLSDCVFSNFSNMYQTLLLGVYYQFSGDCSEHH